MLHYYSYVLIYRNKKPGFLVFYWQFLVFFKNRPSLNMGVFCVAKYQKKDFLRLTIVLVFAIHAIQKFKAKLSSDNITFPSYLKWT